MAEPARSATVGAVASGAIVDVEIDGVEIVVWRTEAGVLSATDARCPHQWSHFAAEGSVVGDELICSSHFWCFAPEGTGTRVDGKGRREPVSGIGVYRTTETADGHVTVHLDPLG